MIVYWSSALYMCCICLPFPVYSICKYLDDTFVVLKLVRGVTSKISMGNLTVVPTSEFIYISTGEEEGSATTFPACAGESNKGIMLSMSNNSFIAYILWFLY